jgi:hypothetical protein
MSCLTTSMEKPAILASGLEQLNQLLPLEWKIEDHVRPGAPAGSRTEASSTHTETDTKLITIQDPTGAAGFTEVLIEVRKELTPAAAATVLTPQVELLRSLRGEAAVLIIAPWLSQRTRTILQDRGYGYLDLTGNVLFRLNRPALFIKNVGADRDPNPRRSIQGVSGPRAGRLVRLLTEFAPPHRASDLASCSGLSISYVSRLLDALEAQALLQREGRFIMKVEWPELLRARAEQYGVLKTNEHVSMLAPGGIEAFLGQLSEDASLASQLTITGSVAAKRIAPVTTGGQLMAYVNVDSRGELERLGEQAGLLHVGQGANVVLLKPADPPTLAPAPASASALRALSDTTLQFAPPSQVALDCLTGPGRMPAEGEAVVQELLKQADWRPPGLPRDWTMQP